MKQIHAGRESALVPKFSKNQKSLFYTRCESQSIYLVDRNSTQTVTSILWRVRSSPITTPVRARRTYTFLYDPKTTFCCANRFSSMNYVLIAKLQAIVIDGDCTYCGETFSINNDNTIITDPSAQFSPRTILYWPRHNWAHISVR